MKKLIILCLLLTACTTQPTLPPPIQLPPTQPPPTCLAPMPTPSIPHEPMCDYAFNSWEIVKEQGYKGLYFLIAEKEALIFVMNSETGLHELGHFVDAERDYPSRTQAFKDAVDEYLADPDPKDPKLQSDFAFWLEIGRDVDDLFAELWKLSLTGEYDLPPMFVQFFNED